MNPTPHSNPETSPLFSTEFGSRLIPLCDGRPGLRCALEVDTHTTPTPAGESVIENSEYSESGDSHPGSSTPVIEFIASTEALDRYDEIISADGWRLENYRSNPVFQNAHQYGDIVFTLGKALATEIRTVAGRPALYQKIEFAVEANPIARIAYGLYKGKFLNAVSVGFIPLRWENGAAGSTYRRKYLEQELLEVSAVGIPANPEALALALESGAIARIDIQNTLALLSESISDFRSITAALNPHPCAPGVQRNGAQLLRLARAFRELLRRF
jgi:HK97 family phage prohead protease